MAEIVLKIPKEFEQDFNADKFKECFERVLSDCKAWDYAGLSGNYEHETLEMLLNAFNEAVVLPKGHGKLIDADEQIFKIEEIYNGYMLSEDGGVVPNDFVEFLEEAPTIIEADKEER